MSDWWRIINFYKRKDLNVPSEEINGRQWIEHFSSLLNCNPASTHTDMDASDNNNNEVRDNFLDEDFTMLELQDALKTLRNGKAAGEDGIPAEFIKNISMERHP